MVRKVVPFNGNVSDSFMNHEDLREKFDHALVVVEDINFFYGSRRNFFKEEKADKFGISLNELIERYEAKDGQGEWDFVGLAIGGEKYKSQSGASFPTLLEVKNQIKKANDPIALLVEMKYIKNDVLNVDRPTKEQYDEWSKNKPSIHVLKPFSCRYKDRGKNHE